MGATVSESIRDRLLDHLGFLYSPGPASAIHARLIARLEAFAQESVHGPRRAPLSEKTSVLITYGDQVSEIGAPPLCTLAQLADALLRGLITDVHVLPFFPYSSDDGFAVVDYERVDHVLGSWSDIHRLADTFGLMTDLVINHASAQSRWFQGYLEGDPEFADFFISVEDGADLSKVVRPRALPLLTTVEGSAGTLNVWTTFSEDQVDLNFANPEVLLRMVDILLSYVHHGATLIRLDAIAYLWKRIGSSCIHCEETHRVVKLLRAVLDAVAPEVLLITETNVPHHENIRYFGDGSDEAQLVYQFPLPPLTVDAFLHGSAEALRGWAQTLSMPPGQATFFNFLASHDGIGLRPLEGLVDRSRVEAMVARTLAHGGRVSYKDNTDGTRSAYELNISFFDALNDPRGDESIDLQIRKFLTAQAIMLGLVGVPGIYFHSLFGSRSWPEGVEERGANRAINREKLEKRSLLSELDEPTSMRARVFAGYRELLRVRASTPAFHPRAPQRALHLDERVFAVLRNEPSSDRVLCLYNVASRPIPLSLPPMSRGPASGRDLVDLLSGARVPVDEQGAGSLTLAAYGTVWLQEAAA